VIPKLHPGSFVSKRVYVQVKLDDGTTVISDIDVLILPRDSELATDIAAGRIGTTDKTPIDLERLLRNQPIVYEVKTGNADLTSAQKAVRAAFSARPGSYKIARVPVADISVRRVRRDLKAFAEKSGIDLRYVNLVARSLKKVLPSDTPYLSALFLGLAILGAISLDSE